MILKSSLIDEYSKLKTNLQNNQEVIDLVRNKNDLLSKLNSMDKYSSNYEKVFSEYKKISELLLSIDDYSRFKVLERELNLFVVQCNKKLSCLFDLNKKGCKS